jgi:hypothetical protein
MFVLTLIVGFFLGGILMLVLDIATAGGRPDVPPCPSCGASNGNHFMHCPRVQ